MLRTRTLVVELPDSDQREAPENASENKRCCPKTNLLLMKMGGQKEDVAWRIQIDKDMPQ